MTIDADTERNFARKGNWRKRGSFGPLVRAIEQGPPPHGQESPLSSAAFRAAELIRVMRRAARLSQAELGKRLGVSQARISELEAGIGSQGPSWSLMQRIADACEATILIAPDKAEFAIDAADPSDPQRRRAGVMAG